MKQLLERGADFNKVNKLKYMLTYEDCTLEELAEISHIDCPDTTIVIALRNDFFSVKELVEFDKLGINLNTLLILRQNFGNEFHPEDDIETLQRLSKYPDQIDVIDMINAGFSVKEFLEVAKLGLNLHTVGILRQHFGTQDRPENKMEGFKILGKLSNPEAVIATLDAGFSIDEINQFPFLVSHAVEKLL